TSAITVGPRTFRTLDALDETEMAPRAPERRCGALMFAAVAAAVALTGCGGASHHAPTATRRSRTRPRVTGPTTTTTSAVPIEGGSVYAHTGAGDLSPAVSGIPSRVYVPNSESNTVDVIDPATYTIIASFPVPRRPQHVVPAWDMKTLYVNSDLGNALTPIDPRTGVPGPPIPVEDPYN